MKSLIFLIYVILPVVLYPGVYAASNINEYHRQKQILSGVELGRRVMLDNLSAIC
jgi:hypothetical protein